MSINTEQPMNAATAARLREMFGEPVAADPKTMLFDKLKALDQREMSDVARIAGQPVTVEVNGPGEVKTMSDGSKYQVTSQGWKKLP